MKKLLLFLALILAIPAAAQNIRVDGIVQGRSGVPAGGAFVAVCSQPANNSITPCSPVVPLCSSLTDLTCTSPNPVQADGLGNYHFYIPIVPNSFYTVQFYGSGLTAKFLPDQSFGGTGGGGGGGVGGTGTPTKLAIWLGATTLGNGSVGDDGTTVSTPENVAAGGSVSAGGNLSANGALQIGALGASGVRCLHTDNSGNVSVASADCGTGTSGSASTYIPLENCAPDQTGNSFYNIIALTNWFDGHWEYVKNTSSFITCMVRVPNNVSATPNASVVIEVAANDATAGHTANFQSCDNTISASGSLNVGSLSCAANQTFSTTTTAYQRSTLTYAVQSGIIANNILTIKIAASATGTAPANNLLLWPYLKIDVNGASGGGGGGSGNVNNFGTPTANQIAQWVDATHIQGIDFCGVTNGCTGLQSGTSGGVLYFSGAISMASSAALSLNNPVLGGGAGGAPTSGTRSGNTSLFMTGIGPFTLNDCLKIDVNGNVVDAGAACGSGGSSGIQSLGGQIGVTQTFSTVNDSNLCLAELSNTNNHQFTVGWLGSSGCGAGTPTTLPANRLNSSVVQNCSIGTLPFTCTINLQTLTLAQNGTWPSTWLNGNVVQAFTNDANICATINLQNATLGWLGSTGCSTGTPTTLSVPRGGLNLAAIANHQLPLGTAANVYTATTVTDCHGGTNALNFTQSTNLFSCLSITSLTNPMTTLGDMIYGGALGAPTQLAGPAAPDNITYTLCSTPTSGAATAPAWCLGGITGRTVAGTSDTILYTDRSGWIKYTSATSVAVILPTAGSSNFGNNFVFRVIVAGAGAVTVTPASGLIDGASSRTYNQGENVLITSFDNANYTSATSPGQIAAGAGVVVSRSATGVTISTAGTTALDFTNRSTNFTTQTVAAAPTNGFLYRLTWYADINTACSTGGNSVSFTFSWQDASAVRTETTGPLNLAAGAPSTSGHVGGFVSVWPDGVHDVTATATFSGTCATGTSTFDFHATFAK